MTLPRFMTFRQIKGKEYCKHGFGFTCLQLKFYYSIIIIKNHVHNVDSGPFRPISQQDHELGT